MATPLETVIPAEGRVRARYVGGEPVMTVVDGAEHIVESGDPIIVTTEQLEQNPVFIPWEE